MEQPTYFRRLLRQRALLIIGAVVALAAGLAAGFTVVDGQVVPRAERTYAASSTVLLTSSAPTYLQVEIPGTAEPLSAEEDGVQEAPPESTPVDVTENAVVLAYIASSDEVVDTVAENVGGLAEGEGITAVSRTTQPAGDETFGGRLTLPIIDVVGVAASPERAELLAQEATEVFGDLVVREQTEWGVPEDVRLVLDEISVPVAGEGEGSNPAIPVVVVAVGVFLLFVALALLIEAARERRAARRARDTVPRRSRSSRRERQEESNAQTPVGAPGGDVLEGDVPGGDTPGGDVPGGGDPSRRRAAQPDRAEDDIPVLLRDDAVVDVPQR